MRNDFSYWTDVCWFGGKYIKDEDNKLCSLSAEPEHHRRHQRIRERHPPSPRGGQDEKKGAQVTFLKESEEG